jgi:hypothetical protein
MSFSLMLIAGLAVLLALIGLVVFAVDQSKRR